MGYSTEMSGRLNIKGEPSVKMIQKLKTFLGKDIREHPEWLGREKEGMFGTDVMTWIDLKLTDDMMGLEWDGSEKFYDIPEKVNLIIQNMKVEYPEFELEGEIVCQGEDWEDRWILVVSNNEAVRVEMEIKGQRVTCPHCEEEFVVEEKKDGN